MGNWFGVYMYVCMSANMTYIIIMIIIGMLMCSHFVCLHNFMCADVKGFVHQNI